MGDWGGYGWLRACYGWLNGNIVDLGGYSWLRGYEWLKRDMGDWEGYGWFRGIRVIEYAIM